MRSWCGSVLVLGLLLLFPACGRKPQPRRTPPGDIDACSLLTAAEVQEAVGRIAGGPARTTRNLAECDFFLGGRDYVNVVARTAIPGESAEYLREVLGSSGVRTAPVRELGDAAFMAAHTDGVTQLVAFKGGRFAVITVVIAQTYEEQQEAIAHRLMVKALERM